MRLDVILRVTTKLILPLMLLFTVYVLFHADFGPGGRHRLFCFPLKRPPVADRRS